MTRHRCITAIRGARLFDGLAMRRGRPTVFVQSGRITDIDFTGAKPPAEARIVDLGDVTLLPGLVDRHQHLVFDRSVIRSNKCSPMTTPRCSPGCKATPRPRSALASPPCATWETAATWE
jgi:imidazolonepropionase-like amidohydrolase